MLRELIVRVQLLWGSVGALLLLWLGMWISGWWGTVTLEFENKPLGRVLDSFTVQTQLPIFTDLDRARLVTIQVRRVTITEALDAIQASAESRGGRLTFLLAPDAAGLARIRGLLPRPPQDSGILKLEFWIPFPAMASLEELPEWGDPRDQTWQPPTSLPRQLVPVAENASQAADIRIFLPTDWNPPLKKVPPNGKISSAIPTLAKLAGAKAEMVYVLPAPRSERDRGREFPTVGMDGWEAGRSRTPSLPPEKWIERLEPRIASLPKEEQATVRASLQESARQFKEWDTLPPNQRQEKIQALMQDPANAERMSDRFSRGMRRLSPEQRSQRYKGYVERRAQAKSGQNP